MSWLLIDEENGEIVNGPFDEKPEISDGQIALQTALGYPENSEYYPSLKGFRDRAIRLGDLEAVKKAKEKAITARFIVACNSGCQTPFGVADCDEIAQGRITRAVELYERMNAAGMPVPPTLNFTMFDESQIPLTIPQVIQLGIVVGLNFARLFDVKQSKERQVKLATSIEEVEALDIESDW